MRAERGRVVIIEGRNLEWRRVRFQQTHGGHRATVAQPVSCHALVHGLDEISKVRDDSQMRWKVSVKDIGIRVDVNEFASWTDVRGGARTAVVEIGSKHQ